MHDWIRYLLIVVSIFLSAVFSGAGEGVGTGVTEGVAVLSTATTSVAAI